MTKKNDDLPKWTKWAKLIFDTSILLFSLIAILLTKATLNEIKEQRIKAYEPEIRMFRNDFKMNSIIRNTDNLNSPINFSSYTYTQIFDSSVFEIAKNTDKRFATWFKCNTFYLPLMNIGQGAAMDMEYRFSLDTGYFIDFFNHYISYLPKLDTFITAENKFAFLKSSDTIFFENHSKPLNILQYVPPYTNNQDTFKINLPISYFRLLSLRSYIYAKVPPDDIYKGVSITQFHQEIPKINIDFNYKDINGLSYNTAYECYFNGLAILIGISKSTGDFEINYLGDLETQFKEKRILN